ncbi:lysylphosphatidylglycerol synthase domain-containing protein [Cellulomonas sp. HZM]|uniref:lysylphosphatidylglycerol synthase domain-containing protein n=1 Tax=Cellulomonas sp. HZM TaxID=1454010 RepID=UPI000AE82DFC|nr:lysylphosphatidylglycerol synthase domain-containing protein [Cellulomonas sp. HZM]
MSTPDTAPASAPDDVPERRRWPLWARLALWLGLGVFAWFALRALIGAIDWREVGQSFGRVPGWAFVPLLALLGARQVLNAIPLALYVPGLGLRHSVQNDLGANVAGTFAPPPGDVVVRVAMFRSWEIEPAIGLAGSALNTVTFYAVRFVAPVLGVLLGLAVAVEHGIERRQWFVALACGLVSVVMLVALALLLRSDELAAWIGRSSGRALRRVRAQIDPERWADAVVDLRRRSADSLRAGLVRALVALVLMVLTDAAILVVALRAVGVHVPAAEVVVAFLVAYPLTLMPLFGFGPLDAVLVGAVTAVAGADAEPAVVAGVLVWRGVTIAGTLALGAVVLAVWRARARVTPTGAPPASR